MIGAYVLVDANEDALYVGSSIDIARRVRNHRNTAHFWREVADVWTYPATDKADAVRIEKHLIHSLRPVFNKNHAGFTYCPCGCELKESA